MTVTQFLSSGVTSTARSAVARHSLSGSQNLTRRCRHDVHYRRYAPPANVPSATMAMPLRRPTPYSIPRTYHQSKQYSSLSAWILSKAPRGFENFYPKNLPRGGPKKADGKPGPQSKKGEPPGKDAGDPSERLRGAFAAAGKKKGAGGGGPDSNVPGGVPGGVAALAVLAAFVAAQNLLNDIPAGREVTWADFRNRMLEANKVDKIVVTNKNLARVVLKPGCSLEGPGGGGMPRGAGGAMGMVSSDVAMTGGRQVRIVRRGLCFVRPLV
mmetsp:Transcript_9645/g.21436  ORF Transcript_9645/g.21436 Transcript_9645/m.21436 type:complete len:269 (-) Transcript_9645:481-1287(-)